ncbi:protein Aster-C [Menidia menidia]
MDQLSNQSLGNDDITDETASLVDIGWTSEEDSSDTQGQCLAAPQAPIQNYKQRLEEFKKLFKEVPESERLLVDYPCALQRDILLQGRLYLSENWVCFYSNVFRGTKITLSFKDIATMSREKTARLIPNAIQICTSTEKFFFTSFSAREKSYQGVFRMWQNTLMDKPLTSLELWQMVKQHYGNDLGLSHEEMESLQVPTDSSIQASLPQKPGGDDGNRRLERPHSLRLPGMEQGPLESSTPQGEELPSPIVSQSTTNTDDSRNTPSQQRSPAQTPDRQAVERQSKRSSNSLDLNANENVSEQSGSESVEEVEEKISQPQVSGRLYLNKVFHMSASKMFELLFTDSGFAQRFMNIRKITKANFSPWQKDPSGNMKRTLSYVITISNPLIGKSSAATESQMLHRDSKDGQYYLVDSEVYTHDVPYHDYFYTHNRYYIMSNSKRKCRLRVYSDVKYRKQPWAFVKSFITKNSWSGIEDYFRQLESELLEEEAELNQAGGELGKMAGLRRRRRTYSRTVSDKPSIQYGPDPAKHGEGHTGPADMTGSNGWSTTTIIAGMSVILLILTVLNLGLFFKLWAMEDVAHRMYLTTKHRLRERSEASLASEYGPKRAPAFGTNEDMHLLKAVLQDSINLLEQLRSSLVVLQQNFASANRTAVPH